MRPRKSPREIPPAAILTSDIFAFALPFRSRHFSRGLPMRASGSRAPPGEAAVDDQKRGKIFCTFATSLGIILDASKEISARIKASDLSTQGCPCTHVSRFHTPCLCRRLTRWINSPCVRVNPLVMEIGILNKQCPQ